MTRLRVGILFGGRSTEHEISVISARNVVSALDPEKFEAVLIGIDKTGRWLLEPPTQLLSDGHKVVDPSAPALLLSPRAERDGLVLDSSSVASMSGEGTASGSPAKVDVVFPVLHGPLGEDGTVQGLLELLDVPFVGSSVLGSAIGMDKAITKRLLSEAKIPVTPFVVLRKFDFERDRSSALRAAAALGFPLFTKPANAGSSVGVRKVASLEALGSALEHAFEFDDKVLAEARVEGREIECAVLGNEDPIASLPGEVVIRHSDGFYSYEAKYLDEQGAELEMPARLSDADVERVKELSVRTFLALECQGMARVDSFLTPRGELIVNEVNTIPGFTPISMYPKLWELSGIPARALVTRLIELALERHQKRGALRRDFFPGP